MAGPVEQAVFNLIDRHQHFEALLREASDDVDPLEKPTQVPPLVPGGTLTATTGIDNLNLSVSACLAYIQSQSHISSTPVPTVAAITCARELVRLQQTHVTPENDLEKKKRKSVECLMEVIKELAGQQLVNRTILLEEISLKTKALPLELLWQLHVYSAVPLDRYIAHNSTSTSVLQRIVQDVAGLCSKQEAADEDSSMKRGVLELLLNCGYSKPEDFLPTDQRLALVTQDILDSIVIELLQVQRDTNVEDHVVAELFETIRRHPSIDKESISRFSAKQLQSLLQYRPDIDPSLSVVTTAVARQHDHWTYAKAPKSLTKMFTQLLLTTEEKQVCTALRKVLHDGKIHWQYFLILVSVFCVCFKRGASLIKDLVTDLLKESLEGCNLLLLNAAFLLARQAAAEGSCDFPAYSQWFQDQFGSSASPHVTSSKIFIMFMEFLTSLVPHDPVHCLEAHIQHPPHIPYKCREVLLDYIDLAKTRMADFKESLQTSDVTGPNAGKNVQTWTQQATEDVEVAVTTFEKTGQILERVLLYSIFRQPYYMGQFLPALLTPRMLPDTPDSKMKFIEALKRSGKIRQQMYQKYTEDCALELKILLEGVSTDDMDDMAIEPIERLQNALDTLPEILMKEPDQTSLYADVTGHISLIAGRVTDVLEGLGTVTNKEEAITLDISGRRMMEPTVMQVTDLLLGCHCKSLALTIQAKPSCSTVIADSFASLFANQAALHHPLYHRLFTLICHQGVTLSEDHITGLASLLVHMTALGMRLPPVKLRTPPRHRWKLQQAEPDHMPLLNLICANLHHRTGNEMKFTLQFCQAVLSRVPTLLETPQHWIIPLELKQKVCYLWPRLHPTHRLEYNPRSGQPTSNLPGTSSTEHQESIYTTFEHLMAAQDPSSVQSRFEKWLHNEMSVHCCQDCLTQTQRKDYHRWALYAYTLPQLMRLSDHDDPSVTHKQASTILLHALLDHSAEPTGNDEHCPHRSKGSHVSCHMDGSCQCSSLWQEGIQLLQELLIVWATASSSDSNHHWLLTELLGRLRTLPGLKSEGDDHSQEMKMGLEVSNQMMLVQCLPPYLLLTDSLSLTPSAEAVKTLTRYINTHLREHLQEYLCAFGYGTVSIILQGVLQLSTHIARADCGQVQDIVAIVDTLFLECPLLTLSIIKHWDMLSPLINHRDIEGTLQSRLFAQLYKIHALVHDDVSSGQSQTSPTDLPCNFADPRVLVIAVVGSCTLRCGENVSVEELHTLERILISKLGPYFSMVDIHHCLFEWHVAQACWSILSQPTEHQGVDVHCHAAVSLLCKQPSCIKAGTDATVLKQAILPLSVCSLYPVICFRILQNPTSRTIVHHLGTDHQLLTPILEMYTSMVHLYCQTDRPITEPDRNTTGHQQLINLKLLHSCLGLVHRLVAISSCQTLAAIDNTSLAATDPEVRGLIAQRLRPR